MNERACLSTEEVAAYADGVTVPSDRLAMETHVDGCELCRLSVVAAVRAGRTSEPTPALERLPPGTAIGRYVVIEALGAGGMGVVYAAEDRELDRKVALKVLRERASRDQLAREAKALAALQHPNVVAVYELAAFHDETFIAMELVDGSTLRTWIAEQPRTLEELLVVLRDAGRGLAAAHDKNLVHRDIKPENILVGRDGRARVTDFGLAQLASTTTGGLIGTVPYMAPELLRGGPADAASDQYSYGVVVYEALTGTRPYAGRRVPELVAALERPIERGRSIPGWLRAVIGRGIATDRARRFPSVAAFVAALGNDPRRRRRMVALAVGALGAGAVATALLLPSSQRQTCESSAPKLTGVWDSARASELRQSFVATKQPFAEDAANAVTAILDRYTTDWVNATIEACRDTHLRGTQTAALLDLRVQCLDERLAEVAALVNVFTTKANPKVVESAARVAQQLTQLAACTDKAALLAQVRPVDPSVAAAVSALRTDHAAARAMRDTGRLDDAALLVGPVVSRAEAIGYGPLIAETLLVRGMLEIDQANYDAADKTLTTAADLAESGRADVIKAEAWAQRVRGAAAAAKFGDAHEHAARARAIVARLGPGHEAVGARLASYDGAAYTGEGNYPRALELQQEALETRTRIYGRDSIESSAGYHSLGGVLFNLGRHADAKAAYEQALSSRSKIVGARHPDVASTHNNLAAVLVSRGDNDAAIANYTKAREIFTALLGPRHTKVAQVMGNIANVYRYQGKYGEAATLLTEAIAIQEQALGPDHPNVGALYYVLGECLHEGAIDPKRAAAAHAHGLEVRRKKLGDTHPDVLASRLSIGSLAMAHGDARDALRVFEQVLAIQLAGPNAETGDTARTLALLGEAQLAVGRPRDALATFRRTLDLDRKVVGEQHGDLVLDWTAIIETELVLRDRAGARASAERMRALLVVKDLAPVARAKALFVLARATDERGAADEARTIAKAAGTAGSKLLTDIDKWLAAHR